MDEDNNLAEDYWNKAEEILPEIRLGYIDNINGVTSSTVLACYQENEDGDYDIFIVIDPEDDYSIEPEVIYFETLDKNKFKTWLDGYGLSEFYKE